MNFFLFRVNYQYKGNIVRSDNNSEKRCPVCCMEEMETEL